MQQIRRSASLSKFPKRRNQHPWQGAISSTASSRNIASMRVDRAWALRFGLL